MATQKPLEHGLVQGQVRHLRPAPGVSHQARRALDALAHGKGDRGGVGQCLPPVSIPSAALAVAEEIGRDAAEVGLEGVDESTPLAVPLTELWSRTTEGPDPSST